LGFSLEGPAEQRGPDPSLPLRSLISGIDFNYAQRWETLLSVDDHVERIVQALADTNRLDNTFIFYASDHGVRQPETLGLGAGPGQHGAHRMPVCAGFQLGQFRIGGDKRHEYEHDIRIPFIVRGPGPRLLCHTLMGRASRKFSCSLIETRWMARCGGQRDGATHRSEH
jgi:hypothetical protein